MDETKERGLQLAAASIESDDLAGFRRVVSGLTLPGQRSVHFCKERDERRRLILTALRRLDVAVTIYDATAFRCHKKARDACLRSLVAGAGKAERLVLELDESRLKADRELLNLELRQTGLAAQLRYDHLRAHDDCLLAIPDAVAWSWAKGGQWRAMVSPLVRNVQRV
ncbi:hypothetical protein AB0C04_18570 [Micromonospora sp. NPDC048909]|uniref:hypothetical protein n=1 Tax=Micromonospora sp. NPDC048909 TaxID=3155643 RepID=UPI0033D1D80B